MKNRYFYLVSLAFLLFIVGGLAIPAATGAQDDETYGDRMTRLERRVATLEERVAALENPEARAIPVSGAEQRVKKDKTLWRSLEKGMTKQEVKKILGEPSGVLNFNENEIWDYASGGSVRFDRSGHVLGWYEP